MFKQLQTLMNSAKGVQLNELLATMSKGATMSVKAGCSKLTHLQARISAMIIKAKASMEMNDFIKNERDKYFGVMVKINYDEFQEFSEVSMELRKQLVMKNITMPCELHLYDYDDSFGFKYPVYILSSVKEGHTGLIVRNAVWVNDGNGKVYSYVPMRYTDYRDYVKKIEKHPYKECFGLNDNLNVIDLKKN